MFYNSCPQFLLVGDLQNRIEYNLVTLIQKQEYYYYEGFNDKKVCPATHMFRKTALKESNIPITFLRFVAQFWLWLQFAPSLWRVQSQGELKVKKIYCSTDIKIFSLDCKKTMRER